MMNWTQFRIRLKWLKANLQLVILTALRSQPMDEWELIDEIYGWSGLRPEEKELRSTLDHLILEGFMRAETNNSRTKMYITSHGLELLSRLENLQQKYFTIRHENGN